MFDTRYIGLSFLRPFLFPFLKMFIWSLPGAVPFIISRNAASTSHDVISGTCFGSVWIMVLCSLSYSSV